MMAEVLTQEQLKTRLHYDPLTGIFTRLAVWSNRQIVGEQVGAVRPNGSLHTMLNGKLYAMDKLAVLYMTGQLITDRVQHLNHDIANNVWSNLRVGTVGEVNQDRKVYEGRNKYGHTGVKMHTGGKYFSTIRHEGVAYHSRLVDTPEEAGEAYKAAKLDIHKFFRENEIIRAKKDRDSDEPHK